MHLKKVCRAGQSLIETALIFPIILLITFGIIEFSRFFWTTNAVSNASREAARIAVVSVDLTVDDERVKNAVLKSLKDSLISAEQLEIANTEAGQKGDAITVSVSLPYKWLTPFPNFLSGNKPQLIKRETVMTYEGTPEELF